MRYSVIIPVHNRENEIKNCVDSVLRQTYKDYEIIAVDDGSTDSSGKILDEYAKKYDFIKVIHKPNGGAGQSRNVGIENASGEYLLFLDDDDEWKEDLLEKVNAFYGDDIIAFGHLTVYTKKTFKNETVKDNKSVGVLDGVRLLEERGALNPVWNKAYKRELVNGVYFPEENSCEDLVFNCEFFKRVKTVTILKDALYVYNRKQSVSLANAYDNRLEENITLANGKRRELYDKIEFVWQEAEILYAHKYIGYEFSKIPNIFRKKNGLKRKEKYKKLKAVIKDKDSKEYFKKVKVTGLPKKLFKFHVKTKTPFLAYINFSFLFFIRNNFSGLYKKIRRK